MIPIQVLVFAISFPPETVEGWFQLYHENWLLGLIHMDLLFAIDNVIIVIMYLSFYITLRQRNRSLMTIAIVLGLLRIASYFSSNTAFEMLSVSKQYYPIYGYG
jgi:predicted tellurium resistance membrane protein TerC